MTRYLFQLCSVVAEFHKSHGFLSVVLMRMNPAKKLSELMSTLQPACSARLSPSFPFDTAAESRLLSHLAQRMSSAETRKEGLGGQIYCSSENENGDYEM